MEKKIKLPRKRKKEFKKDKGSEDYHESIVLHRMLCNHKFVKYHPTIERNGWPLLIKRY